MPESHAAIVKKSSNSDVNRGHTMLSFLIRLPRFVKTLILMAVDGMLAVAALWLAGVIRLGYMPDLPAYGALAISTVMMILVPLVGLACGLYRPVIHFQNQQLSVRAGLVGGLSGAAIAAIAWGGGAILPKAVGLGVVLALLLFALLVWSRYVARWLLSGSRIAEGTPVAIYGAGDAGRQLAAMLRAGRDYRPVAFIDDDPMLDGRTVEDLPVTGLRNRRFADWLRARHVKEVLLAIPSLPPSRRRAVLEVLSELPVHVRSVPRLSDIAAGRALGLDALREVSVEDLLGRDPVAPLPGLLEKCVKGKVILVTGGGGSIGSELCRQALALQPAQLIVLDHSEFALYQIEQELSNLRMTANFQARLDFVLGSVADAPVMDALLSRFRVDTVYHAAAYKHVPIVEHNAREGLRNNVLGTWHLARAAASAGVKHFILISSDKAVRPTNVMGATKRMAELVIEALAHAHPETVFSMVRFGNVLGSSGSVVPLFRDQIERGGPITLTHPEVTRYFMTIEEAVQLVIQAGAMARGGEVFVLDMGEPVKIGDLARKLIQLSGHTVRDARNPHGDIAIEVIGLRPGEKLYEELLISGEATGTAHPRICQVREDGADAAALETELRRLEATIRENPLEIDARGILTKWVTGYSRQAPPEMGAAQRLAPDSIQTLH